jgi:hypothetical protein
VPGAPRFLSNLAALFSQPSIRRLVEPGAAAAILRTIRLSEIDLGDDRLPLGAILDRVYEILIQFYRCEYVYKNEIASKILLGRHSPTTAALMTELQAQGAKADLVLFNGTSNAYEIKTELDSLDRLPTQLPAYQSAFEKVWVVTHPSLATKVLSYLPAGVGLIAFTDNRTLSTLVEADIDHERLSHLSMFNILRRAEYLSIISKHYGHIPDVPNTRIYSACRPLFETLPVEVAHRDFVAALKTRAQARVSSDVVQSSPRSLQIHALVGNLRPSHLATL